MGANEVRVVDHELFAVQFNPQARRSRSRIEIGWLVTRVYSVEFGCLTDMQDDADFSDDKRGRNSNDRTSQHDRQSHARC
jgi:hypothetical protein